LLLFGFKPLISTFLAGTAGFYTLRRRILEM
jgi:hypothetical protein